MKLFIVLIHQVFLTENSLGWKDYYCQDKPLNLSLKNSQIKTKDASEDINQDEIPTKSNTFSPYKISKTNKLSDDSCLLKDGDDCNESNRMDVMSSDLPSKTKDRDTFVKCDVDQLMSIQGKCKETGMPFNLETDLMTQSSEMKELLATDFIEEDLNTRNIQNINNIISKEIKTMVDYGSGVIDNITNFFSLTIIRYGGVNDDNYTISKKLKDNMYILNVIKRAKKKYYCSLQKYKLLFLSISRRLKKFILANDQIAALRSLEKLVYRVVKIASKNELIFLLLIRLKKSRITINNITSIVCAIFTDQQELEDATVEENRKTIFITKMIVLIDIANCMSGNKNVLQMVKEMIEHLILRVFDLQRHKSVKLKLKELNNMVQTEQKDEKYSNTVSKDNYCVLLCLLGQNSVILRLIDRRFNENLTVTQNDFELIKNAFIVLQNIKESLMADPIEEIYI